MSLSFNVKDMLSAAKERKKPICTLREFLNSVI